MKPSRPSRILAVIAFAGIVGVGVGAATPASALTNSGYAIGGSPTAISRPLGIGSSFGTTTLTTEPVVIHAPSMASSEGCPDEIDEGVEITIIHADGVEYNCNTGDYTIR